MLPEAIASGYNINNQIEDEITPLMTAANVGNLEIVKLLVEAGANVNEVNVYGTSPLMFAANKEFLDVFNYLDSLTNSEIKGIELLISACDGNLETVKALISTGIDVDAYKEKGVWQENGRTALLIAIREGHLEIVKLLLEAGADPNLIDEDSGTIPLISAIRVQNIDIIRLLFQAGADINAKDSDGNTAINIAKQIGNKAIVRLFREAGAIED